MVGGKLGGANLGLFSFLASSHPTDTCGQNGLPVTPNSIRILGRFQKLKLLQHPHLCQYVDIVRGKHERLVIVSEFYTTNLKTLIKKKFQFRTVAEIQKLGYEILLALEFLSNQGYVHRNLSSENILFDEDDHVKLSQYGLYNMTNFNDEVVFTVGDTRYMAPEVIVSGLGYNPLYGPSDNAVDIWSLGMVLLDCYLEGQLWSKLGPSKERIAMKLIDMFSTTNNNESALSEICKWSGCDHKMKLIDPKFSSFLKLCLQADPRKRGSKMREILSHEFIKPLQEPEKMNLSVPSPFPAVYRSHSIQQLPDFNALLLENREECTLESLLSERSIFEIYHLWCLTGGDVFVELKRAHLLNSKAPVLALPTAILNNGEEYGVSEEESIVLTANTVCINLTQLYDRLSGIDLTSFYPLVVHDDLYPVDLSDSIKLPLVIREESAGYQFHRIVLFERLLEGYPYTRDRIVKEARIDIPPYVRAKVWAALLNVSGDIFEAYDMVDKVSMTATDRQIEVDIPRCHQYDNLLSSPVGHSKLKSVLKAWVVTNAPKLVYWQGLDSLCAPFLKLNFNNEALAFACLSAFVPKYLYHFFLKDNSMVIHEYLAVFKQLIAFHDPELFNHLNEIGFQPELYAIPWFLTMFSHVFPLQKIYHLWDTLLLGSSMLPLCVGVSILEQFREQLLSFAFNDCILLFSDMPGIDIEKCVKDSIKLFNHTPPSASLRQQDNPENRMKAPSEEQFMNLPEKEFLPLASLRSEICSRISPRDLIRISKLTQQLESYPISSRDQNLSNGKAANGSKDKKKKDKKKTVDNNVQQQKVLVVDTRPAEEFTAGHLQHSVNIPYDQSIDENGQLIPTPQTSILEAHKGRIIMTMGLKGPEPMKLGELLVALNYRRVCVMDGSTSILKSLGYFTTVGNA
ncbi:TBC domain-containing protein kinase-like protein [Clytia hemisphaerica]|uniref:TBC domain-containing protein kinase-like protein n=1 Tax=Clytia hemisphaerica TaxID=252671 RepID=A0A7M5UYQ2_9CNID